MTSTSIDVLIWIVVGLAGLPVCLYVLNRKRRTLRSLDDRRPSGLLARVLVREEIARLIMLLAVLVAGLLVFVDVSWRGDAIRKILIGIELLIVAKSLLWLRYERQMDDIQQEMIRTRKTDEAIHE